MTDLLKSLTQKTSNANASHEISELSPDELAFVAGGKTMPPSDGGRFIGPHGSVDPRAA